MQKGLEFSYWMFRKSIFFATQRHLVIKMDFDLGNASTVIEVKEPKRVRAYRLREDGSLDYRVKEYRKTR